MINGFIILSCDESSDVGEVGEGVRDNSRCLGLINELFSPGLTGLGESGAGIIEDWISGGSCNDLVTVDIGGFGEVGEGV